MGEARIAAARRSAQSHLAAADAASVRRYSSALNQIGGALKRAKKESDNRFGKLYKRMAKHRKALDTKLASSVRFLNVKIASLTSSIKQSEARIKGEISIVSGEVAHDKANQIRINRRVNKEIGRIISTANIRHSQSKRARGKLRAILNANKAAAAQETAALAKRTRFQLAMLRGKMARL